MSAHSDLMRIPKTRGVEIRVSRSRYRNRERVDVREYVGFGEPDSMKPTKRGVNLPLEHLPRLLAALHAIEREAIRDGELLPEDYENAGLEPPPELGGDEARGAP